MGRFVACSARISVDTHTQTDRTTTVTLAAHAHRGLIIISMLYFAAIVLALHSACFEGHANTLITQYQPRGMRHYVIYTIIFVGSIYLPEGEDN